MSTAYAQDCIECMHPSALKPKLPLNPEWPIQFIEVEKVPLRKNPKATYCLRPTDIIDTIVIHHTEGLPTRDPAEVNDYHANRQSQGEPWYMVAYSFLVNSPYVGESDVRPRVTEGRPIEIVGAHAGS